MNWHYTDLSVGNRVKRGPFEMDLPEAFVDYGGGGSSSNTNAAPAQAYPGSGAAYPKEQRYTKVDIVPAGKTATVR
ncbi:hypothetical protein DdX_16407 [Ditylenchus destructor]|uniref:Uncharacterized protein n=1 Tax=Ditylenchus destructor TaxID=166010 RepID=A0AAD4MQD9_9BILA|nr:hypothetical protein DdX_16407 [Ditylenchus destructor]